MFKKILIANRGEIACRVIKTAKKMGIATVAVYSDADKDALHVQMADEAVHIGPPPSAQSYLLIDKIVEACRLTGAEAVHPGYGFLSEKREFQEALMAAGITFIGPDAHAIFAMGDKIESKKLAKKAGVSSVPGFLGVIKNPDEAVTIAREIGYPVMIKASAGGGGKGMRLARNDQEAHDGFISATNEAKSSFADDRVFIEKYIEHPRHIEIQVLGDSFGHVIYLGERECSIQRRHQKVIEEAPSPFLTAAVRAAMGEQAVALAQAVNYKSAGTVEFIVDAERNFFFLEMNTRLQVEHPVTELVTGLDLVEWMIRIAVGEPLTIRQRDVKVRGWAMEARVYAEDPFRNFMPSIGRLTRYLPPAEGPNVRVDTGVFEGGEISMYYDPMIAKLCTFGPVRDLAINHMRHALDEYFIRGLNHNIPFLAALMAHPRFVRGDLTTNFIAEEYPDGFHVEDLPVEDPRLLVAVAAFVHCRHVEREASLSGQLPGHEIKVSDEWVVQFGGHNYPYSIRPIDGGYALEMGGPTVTVISNWGIGQHFFRGVVNDDNDHQVVVQVDRHGIGYRLFHAGSLADAVVLSPRAAELAALMPVKTPPDMSKFLLSPMPGLLVSLAVNEGQDVKAGEVLAVVEAMKMENVLRAQQDGVVATIHARPGESLAVDQKIVEFA
ncbi:acetyl-CoA carboxylase biotin carboxylase subunit [Telmatospirillum sp.]|uniref:acetyl-CoA carboxylase biotin carboxylase subunit n=1 Tax=Telmatospirillum sp. TaxID=2079197 RepID=UPI002845412F|nr:acetyl-CoA carboxylase biotin carboxylase subunit [Telmatospirillum sp.]MDR3439242.1 acetyl-CoA carboxylase biotin carboxylase subunit [Telmatospirillum sp.]